MTTAFIFGAGASHACSSKTPLIAEFFSRAKEIGALCEGMRADVTARLVEKFALDEAGLLAGQTDLESVFSLASMDGEMQGLITEGARQQLAEFDSAFLQHGLESFIYELLMTVTEKELRGNGDLYDRLLHVTTGEDVFITFNYDLQIERALERTSKWFPEGGYGFFFEKILRTDESWHDIDQSGAAEPRLLKLHGSLNWLCSNGYFRKPPNTLDFSEQYKGRHFLAETLYRFPGGTAFGLAPSFPENENEIVLQLNIVPPTLRKQLYGTAETEPLRNAWRLAHQALIKAQCVVIIGYSLPPTDYHAEWLLRTAIMRSEQENVDLIVANPKKEVRQRLLGLFGRKIGNFKEFSGFEEFLQWKPK